MNEQKPNIILILVDDMGYSDIGCYGSEIQTPNLNRLAEKGLRFSQAYNCARCCPTRASLLTGLYPHQAGVGHMVDNHGSPPYQGFLRDDCVTIAEALKVAGYATLMSGKWHVGGHYPVHQPHVWRETAGDAGHPTPRQRGFDEFYGTLAGGGNYFEPPTLMRNDDFIELAPGEEYYYTDAISENASRMIEKAHGDGKPFFCYVAYTAPHWPLHALPEDIAKYEGRYRQGWDRLRQHRHEELKGTGILESKWDISPRDEKAPAWEDADHPDWQDLRMAVYAAQIDRMDQGVGHIMNTLRKLDIEDNTLVMFLADNGGCAEFLREDGQRGRWPEIYSMPLRDGRVTKVGNNPEKKPGPADTFMSYDLPWANASNSPFRLFKSWVHEGGISTPLIVHWPEVIRESRIVHEPCHVVDIMASCLEVSGAAYPREHNGHEVQPLEGESLAPVFRGEKWQRQNPIYFEHQGNRAIRMGDWKLVNRHPGDWELYNMCEDRTELNDLAAGDADRSRKLRKIWQAWADRCGIVDWPPWR